MNNHGDNKFNSRSINCKISSDNQIVLPHRIIDEYKISPRDMVVFIGKRAHGVGIISFSVPVRNHTNLVEIPKQVSTFCGFEPGDMVHLKMIRVVRAHRAHNSDTPAPPRES